MDRMRNATFCLSMPGDSASTRRLSETIMAGCIPVFIGTRGCPRSPPDPQMILGCPPKESQISGHSLHARKEKQSSPPRFQSTFVGICTASVWSKGVSTTQAPHAVHSSVCRGQQSAVGPAQADTARHHIVYWMPRLSMCLHF